MAMIDIQKLPLEIQNLFLGFAAVDQVDLGIDTPRHSDYQFDKRRLVLRYLGKEKTLKEWAEERGMKKSTLYSRIRRGYSVEDALYRKRYSRIPVNLLLG